MNLPPVDKLMKMSEQELDKLLEDQLKAFFDSIEDPERRKRLEALQWKIEIKKKNAPNKMAAMLEVYKMMIESFEEFKDTLNGVERGKAEGTVHVLKA